MAVAVKVIGLEKLSKKLTTQALTEPAMRFLMREGGGVAREEALRLVPRDTGRLASSIRLATSDTMAKVNTTVPYARFQEFGTRRGTPRKRFMAKAKTKATKEIKALIKQAIAQIEKVWGS